MVSMHQVVGVAGLTPVIFIFVALSVGPIGTWLDTAVYSFAAAVGVVFYFWLEDRDLARACRARKAAEAARTPYG
jgi:hypothetical protein